MNTIDGMIKDLESDETVIGGCTTVGEIVIALKSLKERKKGKWEECPHEWGDNWQYSEYRCSICHDRAHFDTDYCPNCGAEMEME